MILLPKVHQLVKEYVIADGRRHLHEPEVQGDGAAPRAGSPPGPLVSDGGAPQGQSVHRRELVQSRDEIPRRDLTQHELRSIPQIVDVLSDAHASTAKDQEGTPRVALDIQARRLAGQED